MVLRDLKVYPHTKFGVPTTNNIAHDFYGIEVRCQGHIDPKIVCDTPGILRCIQRGHKKSEDDNNCMKNLLPSMQRVNSGEKLTGPEINMVKEKVAEEMCQLTV